MSGKAGLSWKTRLWAVVKYELLWMRAHLVPEDFVYYSDIANSYPVNVCVAF